MSGPPRAALALLGALGVPGCGVSGVDCHPGDPLAAFMSTIANIGDLGAACYEGPPSPDEGTEALTGSGGPCAPVSGDDPCEACVRAQCCASALACATDPTCDAAVACRSAGGSAAACALEGGTPGAAYDTALACVASRCDAACPSLAR